VAGARWVRRRIARQIRLRVLGRRHLLADVDLRGLQAVLAAVRAVPDVDMVDARDRADVDLPPRRAISASSHDVTPSRHRGTIASRHHLTATISSPRTIASRHGYHLPPRRAVRLPVHVGRGEPSVGVRARGGAPARRVLRWGRTVTLPHRSLIQMGNPYRDRA
jgi:hypothetical protein